MLTRSVCVGRVNDLSSPVHEEENGPSQSNEALALGGLGPVSCKIWAAALRAHKGHEVDFGENPYEPQGPAADNRVWGRGA